MYDLQKIMKISVITVTYNCIGSIEETIQSVLIQSYENIEYIICDGDSHDGTNTVIKKYSSKIAKYVSESDSGIYNAMNKALDLATGDAVIFLNSGDVFASEDSIYNAVRQFDVDVDVLICKELIEGKVCETFSANKNVSIYIDAFFPHQATFSRTYLYKKDGKFDESYHICADYDWILREYSLGRRIKWTDDVISVYDADGVSSSVKCTAVQYLISKKYILMSGDKNQIAYLDKFYSDLFRKVFFRRLIKDNVSDKSIIGLLKKLVGNRNISVWGFGTIGKALCSFLLSNNIAVKRIIDSNQLVQGKEHQGVGVSAFDSLSDDLIIIASELYDDEICNKLLSYGKSLGKDFLSYRSFSSLVVSELIKNGYDDQDFKKDTGLDVTRYIDEKCPTKRV